MGTSQWLKHQLCWTNELVWLQSIRQSYQIVIPPPSLSIWYSSFCIQCFLVSILQAIQRWFNVLEVSLSSIIENSINEYVDGLEARIQMIKLDEHTQNSICHCDRLYDDTQEIIAQDISSIGKWRNFLEKALDKEHNVSNRRLGWMRLKIDRQSATIATLEANKYVSKGTL